MTSKVFITGGAGLLALNWALAIRDGCSVTLGLHQRNISLAGTEKQQINLESTDHLVRSFEKSRCEVVIHTAGLTNVEACEARPDLARHVNVELSENVAQACSRLGLPLVHISTDHLFYGDMPLAHENDPFAPRNVYGRTKAEAEVRVLQAHPQALVIRPNFFGWGPSYRRSFSDMIIDGLRNGKSLLLFTDAFYTPILIEGVVRATHDLMKSKAKGIFNVVGDERISKYEFGMRLAEKFNLDKNLIKPGLLIDQVALVQRPHDMSLSNKKACGVLGRTLGDVDEHIARLYQQETTGLVEEIREI